MPTKSLQRWNEDGANVKAALEAKGYKVDLQYADNKQIFKIVRLRTRLPWGLMFLHVSIDGGALGGVLQQAKTANIPVIAYDRLITNTDKVISMLHSIIMVLVRWCEFIESALNLDKGEKGPFTMECFGGDLEITTLNCLTRRYGRSAEIHR